MLKHLMTRLTLCAALAAGCLAPASAVAQQAKPEYPKLSFPREMTGNEAVTALGQNLAAVAAWHGFSTDELRRLFLSDQCCQMGRPYILETNGRIKLSESFPRSTRPNDRNDQDLLYFDVFKLHSNPGASRMIYLRFQDQSDTIDNRLYMQGVFTRVAEDFAPFDVDVTT